MTMYFCNDCEHINYTEEEQERIYKDQGVKPSHYCNKYKKRLVHGMYHPAIPMLQECEEDKEEKRW